MIGVKVGLYDEAILRISVRTAPKYENQWSRDRAGTETFTLVWGPIEYYLKQQNFPCVTHGEHLNDLSHV